MSWSDDRPQQGQSNEEVIEKIEVVNSILNQLSKDSNFQSDIRFDLCRTAIDHWTRKATLAPADANKLVENYRVLHVYKRFTELNTACKIAGMGVPVDHILQSRDHLDPRVVRHCFGEQISELYNERYGSKDADSTATASGNENAGAVAQGHQHQHDNEEELELQQDARQDQNIDWKKLILSSLIETIVYGVIAYIMANLVVKSGMINSWLDKDTAQALDDSGSADASVGNLIEDEF